MPTITREDVRRTVAEEFESEEPDAVLEVLKREDGKQLTKRILPKLPGGAERWRIRIFAGMTHLETLSYMRGDYKDGMSILIAHSEKNVMIDAKRIEEKNGAYYAGRRERNAKRLATMHDPVACERMARVLNEVVAAREVLANAEEALDALTNYGEPFSPDSSKWADMGGKVRK